MTNKEKLKSAMEQDINPQNHYHEIIKKIEKKDQMKNNMWKWSFVSICLIIIISGVSFLNDQNKNTLKNNNTNKENNIYLKVNNINTTLTSADIAGSAIDLTLEELINEEELITNIKISSPLNNSRFMKRYDINNEFIGYDLIYYSTNNNGKTDKEIEIFLSKTLKSKPSCYKTINLDKLENSKINNTNVKVLKSNMNNYYALFNYHNYNFDIETNNITEQELSSLLLSIIK